MTNIKQHHDRADDRLNTALHQRTAPSVTLMRRAVRKPGPSLKRQIRITPVLYADNSYIALPDSQPTTSAVPKIPNVKRSPKIKHFSYLTSTKAEAESFKTFNVEPKKPAEPTAKATPQEVKPKSSLDQLLEKRINDATSHLEPSPKVKKKRFGWHKQRTAKRQLSAH